MGVQVGLYRKLSTEECFWTVVLEKTLESPLDCKEIKPVNPKGNQSWIFIGRTDAEAPILWAPDEKTWLIGKDPDAGQDWRREKGTTEDEMAGWHHWRDRHKFEQALGVGDGQGSLVCCSPWGCKESDPTERLNWLIAAFALHQQSWIVATKSKWLAKPKISTIWPYRESLLCPAVDCGKNTEFFPTHINHLYTR